MEKQEKMGQDMKKRKWKNANKGITLIALVITIAPNCCRSGRNEECAA